MNSPPAISMVGVTKRFGQQDVLKGLDLSVPAGAILALLGPNGAGKTTTVRILSTLIRPDAGQIRVAGHDPASHPAEVRARIGVTGQFSAVDKLLTGAENLALMADLLGLGGRRGAGAGARRVTELVDRFGLTELVDRRAETYSGGQLRRLDLAMTLVGGPEVIFLDEPTTGLDPRSRQVMWRTIRDLASSGVTILLTTQYLEEADQLADRIALLDGGRIVAEGTPTELKSRVGGTGWRLTFATPEAARAASRELGLVEPEANQVDLTSGDAVTPLRLALDRLAAAGIDPSSLAPHSPDLADVFFAFTDESRPTDSTETGATR